MAGDPYREHTHEVVVFESATGRLLGWRPLRETKIDEETRAALGAILDETNKKHCSWCGRPHDRVVCPHCGHKED